MKTHSLNPSSFDFLWFLLHQSRACEHIFSFILSSDHGQRRPYCTCETLYSCVPLYKHNKAHLILSRAHSMGFCSAGFTDNDPSWASFHPLAWPWLSDKALNVVVVFLLLTQHWDTQDGWCWVCKTMYWSIQKPWRICLFLSLKLSSCHELSCAPSVTEAGRKRVFILSLQMFGCGAVAQLVLSGGSHGMFLTVNFAFGFAAMLGILVCGQVSGTTCFLTLVLP